MLGGGTPFGALNDLTGNMAKQNVCQGSAYEDAFDIHRELIDGVDSLMTTYHDVFMHKADLNSVDWPECKTQAIQDLRSMTPENRLEDLKKGLLETMFDGKFYAELLDHPGDDSWQKNHSKKALNECMAGAVTLTAQVDTKKEWLCREHYEWPKSKERAEYHQFRYAQNCFNKRRWDFARDRALPNWRKICENDPSAATSPINRDNLISLGKAITQADYSIIHQEVLPAISCPEGKIIDLSGMKPRYENKFDELIVDDQLCRGRPVGITYCSAFLSPPTPGGDGCGAHASVLVGKRVVSGVKQYLIRNSWGTDCSIYRSELRGSDRCNRGDVWVSEGELKQGQSPGNPINITYFE